MLTVAQQKDAPKRVRDARTSFGPEGTVILGHQGDHPGSPTTSVLPAPKKGGWLTVRLARSVSRAIRSSVAIHGRWYHAAEPHDRRIPAPALSATAEDSDGGDWSTAESIEADRATARGPFRRSSGTESLSEVLRACLGGLDRGQVSMSDRRWS